MLVISAWRLWYASVVAKCKRIFRVRLSCWLLCGTVVLLKMQEGMRVAELSRWQLCSWLCGSRRMSASKDCPLLWPSPVYISPVPALPTAPSEGPACPIPSGKAVGWSWSADGQLGCGVHLCTLSDVSLLFERNSFWLPMAFLMWSFVLFTKSMQLCFKLNAFFF